jgi:peptidoglycan/LPS O-acetylase OafA/YrhL
MRSIVKGDCGLSFPDPSDESRIQRNRIWRNRVRRVIALLCLVLAGFLVYELFNDSDPMSSAMSPEWDNPSSVFSWFRWKLSSVGWRLRNEIKGAVPFGNLAVIVKLACCAVAAAVFLRGPNKV